MSNESSERRGTHHLTDYLDFRKRRVVYDPLLSFINRTVNVPADTKGKAVLEVGSAAGSFLRYLQEETAYGFNKVYGVDPDEQAGSFSPPGTFVRGSALDLPFPANSFDFVFIVSVLHHLVGNSLAETRRNWRRALAEACRVVKPGGYVLIHEGIAVRTKFTQWFVWITTNLLARLGLSARFIELEPGERLAFLTSRDMRDLLKRQHTSTLLFEVGNRPWGRNDFTGIVRLLWRPQTCNIITIVQKAALRGN